jgi:hypothetical protein
MMAAEVGNRETPVTATGLTVTKQAAVLPPSCVVTVMFAVPADMPVTNPLLLTVATAVLLLLHVTFLLAALVGDTVAVSCCVAPTLMAAEVLDKETPVTAIRLTVTRQVAVFPPSCVVTVTVVVPSDKPVTNPLLLTVATAVLLLLHVTFLLDALLGETVAVSCCVAPTLMVAEVGDRETPVTATGLTVTKQAAVLPPSCVVTVMFAVPGDKPVTNPLLLTVATAVLLLLHVTFLLPALGGATVAVNG